MSVEDGGEGGDYAGAWPGDVAFYYDALSPEFLDKGLGGRVGDVTL